MPMWVEALSSRRGAIWTHGSMWRPATASGVLSVQPSDQVPLTVYPDSFATPRATTTLVHALRTRPGLEVTGQTARRHRRLGTAGRPSAALSGLPRWLERVTRQADLEGAALTQDARPAAQKVPVG
jgi:hypothetical protein